MDANNNDELLSTRQLITDEDLSDEHYRNIAKLIFDTDDYIFPALFEGCEDPRKSAEVVISHVLKNGKDHLFCKDNLFVCLNNETIVGMVLWYSGTMEWNYEDFIRSAITVGAHVRQENVEAINHTFFETQKTGKDSDDAGVITLFNVCINKSFRGKGIGSFMIRSFVSYFEGRRMDLCVLKDNEPAVKLYMNNGFSIVSEYPGFSQTPVKPMCYGMHRMPYISN